MKLGTFLVTLAVVAIIVFALTWLWRDAVKAPTPGVVHTTDTLRTVVTVDHIVPRPYAVHDTVHTRDTLCLSLVPTGRPDTTWANIVMIDTTVSDVHLYLVYELPSTMYPLGVFSTISVDYPRYLDSVTVTPIERGIPWWAWPVSAGALIVAFLLGSLL